MAVSVHRWRRSAETMGTGQGGVRAQIRERDRSQRFAKSLLLQFKCRRQSLHIHRAKLDEQFSFGVVIG